MSDPMTPIDQAIAALDEAWEFVMKDCPKNDPIRLPLANKLDHAAAQLKALKGGDVEALKREIYELTDKAIDECLGAPDTGIYDVDSGNIQAVVGRVFDQIVERGLLQTQGEGDE